MPSDSGRSDVENPDVFLDQIFPAELAEVRRRRQRLAELSRAGELGASAVPRAELPPGELPSARLGLVGLALSGGGIRSAAFSLGVIQSLVGNRVMPRVDYVSTVSGGGYMGACLDVVMTAPHVRPTIEAFPLHFDSRHGRQADLRRDDRGAAGYSEPSALRHLRDGARYIAPGGFRDLIVLPLLMVRGMAVNLIAILAYATAVTAFAVLALAALHAAFPSDMPPGVGRWNLSWVLGALAAVFVLFLIGTLVSEFRRRHHGRARESLRRAITVVAVGTVIAAAVAAQPWAIAWFWAGVLNRDELALPASLTVAGVTGVALQAASVLRQPPRWARLALVTALGVIGPLLIYLCLLGFAGWLWYGPEDPRLRAAWPGAPALGLWDRAGMSFVVISVVNVVVLAMLDVNRSSMLHFYRDRLGRLFLFRTRPAGPGGARDRELNDVEQAGCDDLRLSDLNPPGTTAPYHLINAAVNLQGSTDASLRGRQADFFMFSKHFSGSGRTGYCPTSRLEREDPELDLATAVAISAAAAAPNMGSVTLRPLVFIMTLLNVRLGYWLPNPGIVAKEPAPSGAAAPPRLRRPKFAVGLAALARELFSRLDERANVVNVTDGGHLENLGVYELLRRRCKVIIVSDAEADARLEFGSLARVMRFARTDLGIDIDLNVDRIRLDAPDPDTRVHGVVGRIRYPGGLEGHLVYLKSTVVGTENLYVRQQNHVDPHFPHTPTSDQFFTEAQLESYRALGFHGANRLFRDWWNLAEKPDAPEWARDLKAC